MSFSRPEPFTFVSSIQKLAVMQIQFVKYHGAGNDFIMIDDRDGTIESLLSIEWIAHACDRHFGIGADGMILIQRGQEGADFFMRYYNADGRTSTFCGNGGRCSVAFAHALHMHQGTCRFLGTDGWHDGKMLEGGLVEISMSDVETINVIDDHTFILDTGSPHYVLFDHEIYNIDVATEGRRIRNSPSFGVSGINVNFVERNGPGEITIRTYERGVEDETLACGTGIVASVIAAAYSADTAETVWKIHARGGDLKVSFEKSAPRHFSNITLIGPAVSVFSGALALPTS